MGSWNMSCSITGCSIGPGDGAVVLLQQPGIHGQKDRLSFLPADYIHTSEDVLAMVFLPVFGTYDDYGRLEWNLDDNPHLRHVVDKYDINALISPHEESEKEANEQDFPDGLFATWIHKYAWDQIVDYVKNKPIDEQTVWADIKLLAALGFKEEGTIEGEDRYRRKFVHPDWPNDVIGSDGQFTKWFERTEHGLRKGPYICTYKDIVKVAADKGLPLDRTVEQNLQYYALDYQIHEAERYPDFDWVEELERLEQEEASNDAVTPELLERIRSYAARGRRSWSHHNWQFLAQSRYNYHAFCNLWGELLIARDPDVMEATIQMQAVSTFAYCAGRILMPTQTGPQCGEPKWTHKLGQITTEISKTAIEECELD